MFEGLFQPIHLLLIVSIAFVLLVPFWRIFKKCGFSPWLSVLMLIPFLGIATLWYVAFARGSATNSK
jgi:hypothetical protein